MGETPNLWASALRSLPGTVFLTDTSLHILPGPHPSGPTLFGYSESEYVGRRPSELFRVEFLDGGESGAEASLAAGAPARVRARLREKNGTPVEATISVTPVRGPDDELRALLSVVQPASRPGDTLAGVLDAFGADLRSVVDELAEGLILRDTEGRPLLVNAAGRRILGFEASDFADLPRVRALLDVRHVDGRAFDWETHPARVALATGRTPAPQTLSFLPGGRAPRRWLRLSARPLRTAPGAPLWGAVSTFSDVTAEYTLGLRLAELAARLEAALEGANLADFEVDVPSGAVTLGPRWAGLFGDAATSEALGLEHRLHAEDAPRYRAALEAHLNGEGPIELTMRVRGVGGRWCWAEVRARVTARDAGGLPLRVAGTFADVTDRIAAQDAAADVAARNAALVVELQSALAQVKTLRGLIPICMHCHKIRDAEGAWERLEVYLTEQTDARLSHGLCPECAVRYYPVD